MELQLLLDWPCMVGNTWLMNSVSCSMLESLVSCLFWSKSTITSTSSQCLQMQIFCHGNLRKPTVFGLSQTKWKQFAELQNPISDDFEVCVAGVCCPGASWEPCVGVFFPHPSLLLHCPLPSSLCTQRYSWIWQKAEPGHRLCRWQRRWNDSHWSYSSHNSPVLEDCKFCTDVDFILKSNIM